MPTKQVPCGFEPRSLHSESRVLAVTPRDQLMEAWTSLQIGLQLPFSVLPRAKSTRRPTACTLAPLHWLGGGLWLSQCFLKICALRCRVEKSCLRVNLCSEVEFLFDSGCDVFLLELYLLVVSGNRPGSHRWQCIPPLDH